MRNSSGSGEKEGWSYYGWVIVAVCLLFITVNYGIRLSFGVFFKSLETEFGWTRALTAGVFSVHMLIGSLFAILAGWFADRHGAKIVLIFVSFALFVGMALTGKVTALWQLFLTYSLIVGMGGGPIYPLATSLGTRWFTRKRALALAIITSGVGLGSILMAPITSYFIADFGWRNSYVIIGIIALVVMLPGSMLIRKVPIKIIEPVGGDSRQRAGTMEKSPDSAGLSLVQMIKARNFLIMILIWFFLAFYMFTVVTHIVPHALDLGIDPLQAATIISVSGFTNVPSRVITGLVGDRFGRKQTALVCALVMAVAMIWLQWSSSIWMLYVFAALFGAGYGGLSPCTTAIVGDTFGLRHIGTIFGLLEIGWVTGAALGPWLAGYIFDTSGTYSLAFWLGMVCALAIAVLVVFIKLPVRETSR